MKKVREQARISVARLAKAFDEPRSTVGRWVAQGAQQEHQKRTCPVSEDEKIVAQVREICLRQRCRTYGYRRVHAILKKEGTHINRKTVLKIMQKHRLTQPKVWRRPQRPKRVEKMRPRKPNQGWQIDMTSLQLDQMRTVYLVVVIDCCSRKIMGWGLSHRCRAQEWIVALRMALETAGIECKDKARGLTLRSDNGAQPCSKKFVEFLGARGVKGQYTGYDTPDDNAYVERVIRTIKEEEVWPNSWDTFWEAHEAIEKYVKFYNDERPHSALNYQTPEWAAKNKGTLNAA
ncbi:MAG: IS3 family transposase [FCB group bacterium]|nr:IS3 family transposase [FCB group bacterium]